MSIVTIMWQNSYCTATTLSSVNQKNLNCYLLLYVVSKWLIALFIVCLLDLFSIVSESEFTRWEIDWFRPLVENFVGKRRSQLWLSEKLSSIRITRACLFPGGQLKVVVSHLVSFVRTLDQHICYRVMSSWYHTCVVELVPRECRIWD